MRPALFRFRLGRFAAVVAALGLAAGAPVAGAEGAATQRPLRVSNHTSQAILNLYAAGIDAPDFADDALGNDVLPPGGSATIQIAADAGQCRYDLRAVFENGRVQTARAVDVCARGDFEFVERS